LRDGAKLDFETGVHFLREFKRIPETPSIFSFFPYMDMRERTFILPRRSFSEASLPDLKQPNGEKIYLVKDETQETEYGQWQGNNDSGYQHPSGRYQRNNGYYGPKRNQYNNESRFRKNEDYFRKSRPEPQGKPLEKQAKKPEEEENPAVEPRQIQKQADRKKKQKKRQGTKTSKIILPITN
jgi:hypothetical protein